MKFPILWAGAPILALALLAQPVPVRGEGTAAPVQEPLMAERAGDRKPAVHQTAGNGIEYRMRLLAAELALDAHQQTEARRILEDQRALTLKAWGDESVPSAVRVKATQAIGERTADRIRAILTAAQRERYLKRLPSEARPGTTSASLEGYIDATQRN